MIAIIVSEAQQSRLARKFMRFRQHSKGVNNNVKSVIIPLLKMRTLSYWDGLSIQSAVLSLGKALSPKSTAGDSKVPQICMMKDCCHEQRTAS